MPRPHAVLPALLIVCAFLAGCGDRKAPKGTTNGGGAAATPFVGHDLKQVKSAFPDDGREVLEQADTVTFFTLNPTRLVEGKLSPEKERLRNYGVLGKVEITDAAERRRLVEAIYEGLRGEDAGPADCFIPRHGLRFTRGSRTIEFVICFQCTWVHIYQDDAEHATRMLFGAGVRPVFDAIVERAKLAFSKQ